MKQKMKILLGLSLALFLALPLFAQDKTKSQIAQEKLENQIYSLLQQGKYEKVKTTLENIPVCPESGLTEAKLPTVPCTLKKFNPDPLKMEDSKEIDVKIRVNLPGYPGYTKPVTLTVIRPATALRNSLTKEFNAKLGEYDRTKYLQFPNQYEGSWIKDVVIHFAVKWIESNEEIDKAIYDDYLNFPELYKNSWLQNLGVKWIWGNYKFNHDDYKYLIDDYEALYTEVKRYEAQGLTYHESEIIAGRKYYEDPYGFYLEFRLQAYNPFGPAYYFSYPGIIVKNYNTLPGTLNHVREIAKKHNDEKFAKDYQQNLYYALFNLDPWSQGYDLFTIAAEIVWLFGINEGNWDIATKDMPSDLLKEMQDNVTKYFAEICKSPDHMYEIIKTPSFDYYAPKKSFNAQQYCRSFIKHAKEYGLWTNEAQKKYDSLRGVEVKSEVETKANSLIQNMIQGIVSEGQQKISY